MTTKKLGSEPAYPCEEPKVPALGLTIRQEFAKAAMIGLLGFPNPEWTPADIARNAACLADALLAELAK